VTNSASVEASSSDTEGNAANNTDTEATTVIQRTTMTTVSCTPASVVVNEPTVCTATVTDTDQGQKADPTGTVTFSAAPAASGTFSAPGATCTLNPDSSLSTYTSSCTVTYEPTNNAGTHVLTGTYDEASSPLHKTSNGAFSLSVGKRATATTLTCTPLVVQIGQTITCKATVTDVEPAGTKTNPQGTVTFSPPGTTASCTLASDPSYTDRSSCSITYVSATADVIGVVATYGGSNVHKPSTSDRLPIVFYDPSGGFVTGGGYIMQSPTMAPSGFPIGKNNYGFVAKYVKNSSVPQGEMEFQCKVCGFNFHGKTYDWLVIKTLSDGRKHAQAQGSGTVNGVGDYGFIVTVIDGGNKPDYFRIRIWNKTTGLTFYDSQPPSSDDTQLPATLSEGGNIVIHAK
ncbi:MAG TPA: hypothetical protein VEW95_09840, partial [Candidatus Limnocylindrales bacterium]|nr:hypothetical protein [Candidatus Limnocylindrales bacterium]